MGLDRQEKVAAFGLAIYFLTSLLFFGLLFYVKKLQEKALNGDQLSGRRMLLPCYKPFIVFLAIYFLFLSIFYLIFLFEGLHAQRLFALVQFSFFCTVAINTVIPYVLVIPFITYRHFLRMFFVFAPWYTVSWLLLGLPRLQDHIEVVYENSCQILFVLFGIMPPLIFGFGLYFGYIKSRLNKVSKSSTNSLILLITSSLTLLVTTIVFLVYIQREDMSTKLTAESEYALTVLCILLTIMQVIFNLLSPIAAYRTLNADTKYWRGIGKYHEGGITKGNTIAVKAKLVKDSKSSHQDLNLSIQSSASGDDRYSEVEFSSRKSITNIDMTVASDFQVLLNTLKGLLIDFALVDIDEKIGAGATAAVYKGEFRKVGVAVKVTNPPEITVESLTGFKHEADMLSLMSHENVVKFYGIIIRPPQVGMVFELCPGGSLKEQLTKFGESWTYCDRVRACQQAASAIDYIHKKGIMHRDVKPDNFFVGKNKTIKLGDFGESCLVKCPEDVVGKMEICGTVAYMAPELVKGSKWYNEKIDIYALAISFWEIITSQEPYSDIKTFEIYNRVSKGERLSLHQSVSASDMKGLPIPEDMKSVLKESWGQEWDSRLNGEELSSLLQEHLHQVSPTATRPSMLVTKELDNHFEEPTIFSFQYWIDLYNLTKLEDSGIKSVNEVTDNNASLSDVGGKQKVRRDTLRSISSGDVSLATFKASNLENAHIVNNPMAPPI